MSMFSRILSADYEAMRHIFWYEHMKPQLNTNMRVLKVFDVNFTLLIKLELL